MEIKDKFLSPDNCEESDIVTFVDAGVEGELEYKGKKRTVYNFTVSNGRYELTYTPGASAQKEFIKAWGKETDNWKGKKFQVKIVEQLGPQGLKKVIFPVVIA